MKCPTCGSSKTHVLEIRQRCDSAVRRRVCTDCQDRFTTVEHYRDTIANHEQKRLHKIRKEQYKKRVTPAVVEPVKKKPAFVEDAVSHFDEEEADILNNFRKNLEWT